MPKFFRKTRELLLMENKTAKYLKYALGEVLLVVVGILIAFQIEDWNENRKNNETLIKIYERLVLDIEKDISELGGRKQYYDEKKWVFLKVMNDSVSADLFDEGLSRLVGDYAHKTNFSTAAIQQLKALNTKDPIAVLIVSMYADMESLMGRREENIYQMSQELLKKIRDNQPWFPEWVNKTIMKDNSSEALQTYFLTSMEYRNAVAQVYNEVYNNYLPDVNQYLGGLHFFRNRLKAKLDPDYVAYAPEELKEFVGTYEIADLDCPVNPDAAIGDRMRIEATPHSLLVKVGETRTINALQVGVDRFSSVATSGLYQFERDASRAIVGYRVVPSIPDVDCWVYYKKVEVLE
jgi:hypothetical protein